MLSGGDHAQGHMCTLKARVKLHLPVKWQRSGMDVQLPGQSYRSSAYRESLSIAQGGPTQYRQVCVSGSSAYYHFVPEAPGQKAGWRPEITSGYVESRQTGHANPRVTNTTFPRLAPISATKLLLPTVRARRGRGQPVSPLIHRWSTFYSRFTNIITTNEPCVSFSDPWYLAVHARNLCTCLRRPKVCSGRRRRRKYYIGSDSAR